MDPDYSIDKTGGSQSKPREAVLAIGFNRETVSQNQIDRVFHFVLAEKLKDK